MPGAYWTWNPENEKCELKRHSKNYLLLILFFLNFIDNNMQEAEGHHCGDHVGSKHWANKKIINGNCENCGPVRVKIGPLLE